MINPVKEKRSTRQVDECSVMAAIALFVITAPLPVTTVTQLHNDCVEIFIRAVKSTDANVSTFGGGGGEGK